MILETTAGTFTAAMQLKCGRHPCEIKLRCKEERTLNEIESNAMALALIDILYVQGVIDHELYYRIQAKNKAFVKAEKD